MHVRRIPSTDPRLNRHVLHDGASRGYALTDPIDKTTWRDKSIRIWDPRPNPNQSVGNCTTCAKAMQLNAVGNRQRGVVLDMAWATTEYELETRIDPFPGYYLPGDPASQDTGSNGLSSCKAAQQSGDGGAYYWEFRGADGVVQNIMAGRVLSIGTKWYDDMFTPDADGVIAPTGDVAGGHQYVAHRYWHARDLVGIRCWWGPDYRDVWIARTDLDSLLADQGDAHWQARA